MDITQQILSQLQQYNQSEPQSLTDLIDEFQSDVRWLDAGDMTEVESQLMKSQYAYVKFGLVLEKVRNQCMWQKCVQKFKDFRHFCQHAVNLNIWQVCNAIESAKVAVKLVSIGFSDLPRNASQALKLAKLPIERLAEVWGNVLDSCEGHKITAHAIESQINPDKQTTSSTVKIPTALLEKLQREALDSEISLEQLIEELLATRDAINSATEPVAIEMSQVIPELAAAKSDDVKLTSPKPNIDRHVDRAIDSFDRLMMDLTGLFVPTSMRKSPG